MTYVADYRLAQLDQSGSSNIITSINSIIGTGIISPTNGTVVYTEYDINNSKIPDGSTALGPFGSLYQLPNNYHYTADTFGLNNDPDYVLMVGAGLADGGTIAASLFTGNQGTPLTGGSVNQISTEGFSLSRVLYHELTHANQLDEFSTFNDINGGSAVTINFKEEISVASENLIYTRTNLPNDDVVRYGHAPGVTWGSDGVSGVNSFAKYSSLGSISFSYDGDGNAVFSANDGSTSISKEYMPSNYSLGGYTYNNYIIINESFVDGDTYFHVDPTSFTTNPRLSVFAGTSTTNKGDIETIPSDVSNSLSAAVLAWQDAHSLGSQASDIDITRVLGIGYDAWADVDPKTGEVIKFTGVEGTTFSSSTQHATAPGTIEIDGSAYNDSTLIMGAAGQAGADHDLIRGGSGNNIIIGTGLGSNYLYGGSGDDVIVGGPGSDTISGGGGSNTYISSMGNDTYQGSGSDTIYYGKETSGVLINDNSSGGYATHSGQYTDTFSGIKYFIGSTHGDTFEGSGQGHVYDPLGASNTFISVGGNDQFLSQNPTLYGNTVEFTIHGAVNATMSSSGLSTTDGELFEGVGTIIGSNDPDILDLSAWSTGSSNSIIHGEGGNDQITAGGGVHQIYGDLGDDTITITSLGYGQNIDGDGPGAEGTGGTNKLDLSPLYETLNSAKSTLVINFTTADPSDGYNGTYYSTSPTAPDHFSNFSNINLGDISASIHGAANKFNDLISSDGYSNVSGGNSGNYIELTSISGVTNSTASGGSGNDEIVSYRDATLYGGGGDDQITIDLSATYNPSVGGGDTVYAGTGHNTISSIAGANAFYDDMGLDSNGIATIDDITSSTGKDGYEASKSTNYNFSDNANELIVTKHDNNGNTIGTANLDGIKTMTFFGETTAGAASFWVSDALAILNQDGPMSGTALKTQLLARYELNDGNPGDGKNVGDGSNYPGAPVSHSNAATDDTTFMGTIADFTQNEFSTFIPNSQAAYAADYDIGHHDHWGHGMGAGFEPYSMMAQTHLHHEGWFM